MQCMELYNFSASQELPKSLATMSLGDIPSAETYMDSGASYHMVNSEGMLHTSSPYSGSTKVMHGDRSSLPIKSLGSVTIPTHSSSLKLNLVL